MYFFGPLITESAHTKRDYSILVYIEYQSFCPFVGLGTPPIPLPHKPVSLPLTLVLGEPHSLAGEGTGGTQFHSWDNAGLIGDQRYRTEP